MDCVAISDVYSVINVINEYLYKFQNNNLIDTGVILGNYNLHIQKTPDCLQVSIIEKRGIYKCEDDIFCIKKVTDNSYKFWDVMNYVQERTTSLQEISNILIKTCPKINLMYKILQQNRLNKPALLDSDEPLFCLNTKYNKQHIIKYDPVTKNIKILEQKNYNKINPIPLYELL